MAAYSRLSPAPVNKIKTNEFRWKLSSKKVIKKYIREARTDLAAVARDGADGNDAAAAAAAALSLVTAVLEVSPRMEAALELRARALLVLRRYRDIADMFRDYIPSCTAKSGDGDKTTSSSSSSRSWLLSGFLRIFDVSGIKRHLLKRSNAETHWRYLVLGQACFHLGLLEDAAALLQTRRRLACAAAIRRRQSVCWSGDSFSTSNSTANARRRASSKVGSASGIPLASEKEQEEHSVSQLLAHVKLLLRRRATATAAMDAGFPAEAARQFSKVLDGRHGGVLPHPFATSCFVGRATAFRAVGCTADAIADCNRALALDPVFIPARRARADLFESIGMILDSLRDLDYLKLLYDVALRDGKLSGPSWRPQGGVRKGEIAAAHGELVARIQQLRGRLTAGDGCRVDYYALLGVRRGCTRAELLRAHLLLTVKLKPDRAASFTERLELVDEHRNLKDVRDQARTSARILYRMLRKGYSHISALLDEEDAVNAAVAAAASAPKQEEASVC